VAASRLTCGQPPDQRLFPQVTGKCEGLTQTQVRGMASPAGWPSKIICHPVVTGTGRERVTLNDH